MNLIKYLETYVNTKSALARFFVILIHMPILAVVMAIHLVEAVVRMVNSLVTGIITVVSGSLTDAHTFIIEGWKVAGSTVLKVAKGPAKVVAAVKASAPVTEMTKAADAVIADVKSDYAEAVALPTSFAQRVEAAAKAAVASPAAPAVATAPAHPVMQAAPAAPVAQATPAVAS